AVNEQLDAKVLTRSSHSSRTSYDVAADLFKMELKKILIEKMEGNKSIKRSDEQRNLYKALVEAYESDKILLDTYRETVTLKRRRDDDENKDEEPCAGPDRGSKRRIEGKEPKSASAPSKTATKSTGRVNTLTPELLAGPTYDLMKGSCKSLIELEYHLEEVYKAITDQLDWVNPEGQQYPHNLLQPLSLIPNNQGRCVIPFAHFINNDLEYLRGGASSRKYTTSVTKTKAANYGHIKESPIEGINVSSSTVSLLTGNLLAMYIQKEESLLSRNSRLWNGIATSTWIGLRIVIQRRVEDLQLGVESYQKRLNLTKPDSYRSDMKRKEAYTAYFNPRGFIYQNKDKKNRLMRIDELHKFSDGMLTDVRTALDDRLKGIRMWYLPQTIWRKSDKDRAAAMIQAIDKILKTKRIMRSLESTADAKIAIQEIVEYSQKWHNETSLKTKSIKTYDELDAIQAQLNNLGREIKKVNKKVYAAQILDSKGAIPIKSTADAKIAIQEIVEYSQKWHNETSLKTRSIKTYDELDAIQAQLNNLGREIKKVNKKVYAAQVGCKLCKGPRYIKDCPLKEEGKTLEEAYYTQFEAPYQPTGQYRAAGP
nr:hypothetical protein [Tanacetum cinerariifolium]